MPKTGAKKLKRRLDAGKILLIALAVVAIGVAWYKFKPTPNPKPIANSTKHTKPPLKPIEFGAPISIEIPSISVNTKIEAVGLTAQNNVDVPSSIINVGWYKFGATPGNTGTAVIDGHLDGSRGQPAVFFNLKKLVKGDQINISDGKHTATYVVDHTQAFSQLAHPEEVFDSGAGSHLNLITCMGTWDKAISRYNQRLVVFTNLVD